MRRAIAIVVSVFLSLIGFAALFFMVSVTGLPLCEDRAAAVAEGACIQTGATSRAIGLVAGWGGTLAAFAATGLGIHYAATGRGGGRLALVAVAGPVLAIVGLFMLPASF